MSETSITSVEHLPGAIVVHVLARNLVAKVELDAICGEIDKAHAAAPSLPFILDMANVAFMGSLAMGTLVGLNKEFQTRSQRLIFASLQLNVHHSFSVTHMDRIVEIKSDVPTALQSLGANH
jgi:anti-anti-sigma factor